MALVSPTQVELNGAITSASVNTPINQLAAVINGGIDSNNLADGAVSTAKLVDGAVTQAKLSTTAGELGGAWASWTPTLTNITLGNGTVVAKYSQIGKTVRYKLSFTMGTTSAMGDVPKFTLPVTAAAIAGNSNGIVIGRGSIWDFGTNNFDAVVVYETTTLAAIRVQNATFNNVVQTNITSTNPMTWASTDEMHVSGEYEAA